MDIERSFYEEFKKLRNQLRMVEPLSLVGEASVVLRELETLPVEQWGGWTPWDLLLLIRWGVIYGGENRPLNVVDRQRLIKLVNLAKDVGSHNPFLEEGAQFALAKWFRSTAFQQFWLQHELDRPEIGREGFLVDQLAADGPAKHAIRNALGVGAEEFHELLLVLILWLRQNPRMLLITPALFENADYDVAIIHEFLQSISADFDTLKVVISTPTVKSPLLQVLDRTPLVRHPLLRVSRGRYHVYSNRVLEDTYRTLLHDVARDHGGSGAAEELGAAVCKHVERGLTASHLTFLREGDLKARFGQSKVTDFVVLDPDCTVLIEAKAGDIRPTVRVFPANRQLINELEDSVLKALHQGFALVQRMKQAESAKFIEPFYLLVVTHRETYIGPMVEAWEEFVREGLIVRLEKDDISLGAINPSHIFVLSVRELDELVRILSNSKQRLGPILSKAAADNADPRTRKYTFEQHLRGLAPDGAQIEYLYAEGDRLMERVKKRYRD